MRKSEHVLDWLKRAERPSGGISAWCAGDAWKDAYPEVTGYLIPTLYDYGENELAGRCADWLVSIQRPNGSYLGIDGISHAFDTGAVYEGLQQAFIETRDEAYIHAARKAHAWLTTQIRKDGTMRRQPDKDDTHLYTLRVSGLIYNGFGANYWLTDWPKSRQRTHYILYAIEGLLKLERRELATDGLQRLAGLPRPKGLLPAWVRNWQAEPGVTDTCATCQLAYLMGKVGMDGRYLLDEVEKHIGADGGLPHGIEDPRRISWAAKFYLDAVRAYG